MNQINLLVTGAGGGGIGEQVIKCLRFSSLNCKIIATDITEISKGKIDADEFVIVPFANDISYVNFILNLCKEKKIDAIIPGSEIELKIFSKNRLLFYQNKVELLINSEEIIDICLDKNLTSEFLESNGFLSPKSFAISNSIDLESISIFPLVLKPSIGGGGSVNTLIVQNKQELYVFGTTQKAT
jgi:carbamoyl-phosphate synthase large subunit